MWVMKDQAELLEEKRIGTFFRLITNVLRVMQLGLGTPYSADVKKFGCVNCGSTFEAVKKNKNGTFKCQNCGEEIFPTDMLKWVENETTT